MYVWFEGSIVGCVLYVWDGVATYHYSCAFVIYKSSVIAACFEKYVQIFVFELCEDFFLHSEVIC